MDEPREDDGMTLVELLVAMSIFTVLMIVVLTTVVSLSASTVRVQNVTDSADDLRRAFLQMDRQVRYADAVNIPGQVGGDWYVEFHTSAVPPGQSPRCTQWRHRDSTKQLQVRSWNAGSTPPTTWTTVATTLLTTSTPPFALRRADTTYQQQRLTVTLDAGRGADGARGRAELATRFVARSSSLNSLGNVDADANGVSDNPVCGVLSAVRS